MSDIVPKEPSSRKAREIKAPLISWAKLEPYLLPAILVLLSLSAFGLGRLSATGGQGARLIINVPEGSQTAGAVQAGVVKPAEAPAGEEVVASKSGSKYYLPSCSGASRIKQENLIHFNSAQEARAAGYEPAANCPGLE